MRLPGIQADILTNLMLEWKGLVDDFGELPQDEIQMLLTVAAFTQKLFTASQHGLNQIKASDSEAVKVAVSSICSYTRSLSSITSAKTIKLLIAGKKIDVAKLLIPEHAPLVMCLENIQKTKEESKGLRSLDFQKVLAKLKDWETVTAALSVHLINDPLLKDLKAVLLAFDQEFGVAIGVSLKNIQAGNVMKNVRDFITKYQAKAELARDWQEDKLAKLFATLDATADFKSLNDNLTQLECELERLSSFVNHSSGQESIKTAVAHALEVKAEVYKALGTARETATFLVMSAYFFDEGHEADLDASWKFCQARYHYKMDDLPDKLKSKIQKGLEDEKSDRTAQTSSKKKKDKKEKKEKAVVKPEKEKKKDKSKKK